MFDNTPFVSISLIFLLKTKGIQMKIIINEENKSIFCYIF